MIAASGTPLDLLIALEVGRRVFVLIVLFVVHGYDFNRRANSSLSSVTVKGSPLYLIVLKELEFLKLLSQIAGRTAPSSARRRRSAGNARKSRARPGAAMNEVEVAKRYLLAPAL